MPAKQQRNGRLFFSSRTGLQNYVVVLTKKSFSKTTLQRCIRKSDLSAGIKPHHLSEASA